MVEIDIIGRGILEIVGSRCASTPHALPDTVFLPDTVSHMCLLPVGTAFFCSGGEMRFARLAGNGGFSSLETAVSSSCLLTVFPTGVYSILYTFFSLCAGKRFARLAGNGVSSPETATLTPCTPPWRLWARRRRRRHLTARENTFLQVFAWSLSHAQVSLLTGLPARRKRRYHLTESENEDRVSVHSSSVMFCPW